MIARWRDQLDRQIIVFVAFYVGNKKFPQKLLSRWRRVSTSSSSWTAPRPPGRRSSPCCKSMFSHVSLSWTISLHKDRSWFSKREHCQNVKIAFDEMELDWWEWKAWLTTLGRSRGRHTAWRPRCRQVRARNPALGERFRSGRCRTWHSRQSQSTFKD